MCSPAKAPSHLLFLIASLFLSPTIISIADGAKILFYVGLSSHSHRVAVQPLATALADRGHDVTFFSPIKPEVPHPKIKEYCTKQLLDFNKMMQKETSGKAAVGKLSGKFNDPVWEGSYIFDLILGASEAVLGDAEFIQWFNSSQFDLIVYDVLGKEFLYPIANRMKAKIIANFPMPTPFMPDFDNLGLPIEPWFDGMELNRYESFLPDRYFNTYNMIKWHRMYKDYYLPKMEAIMRKSLDFDYPPLETLTQKTDLVLVNEHFSGGTAPAYPPYVVPVGGMHCKDSNGTLPKDIEDFLSDTQQFVFISFGSVIRVSALPKETQNLLFDSVGSFKDIKFLWKWEGEIPDNVPKNALAKNWFPQQDVLAHKKIKGFITQGGIMSLQQAIYHSVPVLVIPGFGDQTANARTVAKHGYGIYLEISEVTKESLTGAIDELVNNQKYSNTMRETSKRFKDRPMSPVETAVWWTEYVLRHDTAHLKSESIRLTWWERRLLDFWAILFVSALSVALLFGFVLFKCFKLVREGSSMKVKTS